MSDSYKKSEKALKEFKKQWRANGYKPKEVQAVLGGWEWAMEQMHDHKTDRYEISRLDGDGSDAAMDMSRGYDELTENQQDAMADTIYNGICAARTYVRETYGGED